MAQTTGKSPATKKVAPPPKALSGSKASSKPSSKPSAAAKPTAAKPAAAKSAAAKPSSKTASSKQSNPTAVKKPSVTAASSKGNGTPATQKKSVKQMGSGAVTPEQRYRMICDAAYFRAEQRGFIGGSPEQDWCDAEIEVDQQLCAVQSQQKNH